MKHLFIIFLFCSPLGFSQIPTNYYNSANGKTGYNLKTELKKIIDNNNDGLATEFLSIDLGYSELYITYETSDIDSYFENNGTVLDIYSEKPNGLDSYEYTYEIESPDDDRDSGSGGTSEGEFYNREHIIPQSVFNQNYPMRSDAHFVVPSDKYVNSQRGSFPFGVVSSSNWTSSNGSKRGSNLNSGYSAGYSNTVFEPIDEFKGDIARMHFYFVTRYQDDIASFNSYDMFNGSVNQVLTIPFFNILYQWHILDPVSQKEIDRNNAIFDRQNNRNPFIDHPEYVQTIWSNLLSVKENTLNAIYFYPNPINGNSLKIKTNQTLNVAIFDVLGKSILKLTISPSKNEVNVENLTTGLYLVRLSNEFQTITKKLIRQ